jgi:selenocysteine lyase/cysteine desulfurase
LRRGAWQYDDGVPDLLAEARALFDPAPNSIYLDSATYGLPPRPTVETMHRAIDRWQSGTADWVAEWDRRGDSCRVDFASLIGAPGDAVALVPTVSVGVGVLAAGLDAHDQVVVPDDEFTSVLYPLLVAHRAHGVRVSAVPLDDLPRHISSRTTLVAFSLIQSQSGRAAPMTEILAAARAVGARTLVDATHAVPFVPVANDLQSIDYLVCAAYKHLLCPRGVAFMYVAPERWDAVEPILANWRSASDPYGQYYGGGLDLAPTAARFDVSLAWFSWAGASVSLGLLADWQRRGLLPEVVSLTHRLANRLSLSRPLGNVLSVPVDDAEAVRADLAASGVRAAVRAGSVRLAPHVYNTADEIDRTARALMPFVQVAAAT